MTYNKAYYEANKERLSAQKKAYREAHPEYFKKYREDNKERLALGKKMFQVKKRYGLTPDEYYNLVSQGCNVCGASDNLCIDHDHKTGKVRGCLCSKCNIALGGYENVIENWDKFAEYLRGTP
jgi:hypothetical protein